MKLNLKIVAATAAVAMMSASAAQAAGLADIEVGPLASYTYSKEGLALSGTTGVALPNVTVTFGNNLTYQDDIYISLPGVTSVALVPSPTLVTCTTTLPAPATPPAVGYVTTVNGGWNFRVTSVSGVNIGDQCTFTGLSVAGASLANSNGTLNYQANRFTTGQLVDSASNDTGIDIISQFGITEVTKLNAEIDVYANRYNFVEEVPPEVDLFTDTLEFDTFVDGDDADFTGPVVTVSGQSVTIDNGTFDWTGGDDCFDSGLSGFGGWSVNTDDSTCNSLVLDGPTTNTTNSGAFVVPGDVILSPTDWQGEVTWTYYLGSATNSGATTLTWDPGVWTINGAQVYIQYMPYGTGISRIIYAANSGVINADGTVDVIANGSTTTCDLGAINKKTVTQLSAVVDACVAGAGIASGRVALLMTFTAPDTDIEVYSAYNVNGSDRGTVVNTSNGRGLSYFSKVD